MFGESSMTLLHPGSVAAFRTRFRTRFGISGSVFGGMLFFIDKIFFLTHFFRLHSHAFMLSMCDISTRFGDRRYWSVEKIVLNLNLHVLNSTVHIIYYHTIIIHILYSVISFFISFYTLSWRNWRHIWWTVKRAPFDGNALSNAGLIPLSNTCLPLVDVICR